MGAIRRGGRDMRIISGPLEGDLPVKPGNTLRGKSKCRAWLPLMPKPSMAPSL